MSEARTTPDRESAIPAVSESMTDIAKLDLALKIRQSHHSSVWEEQKHFTWLISIILSAQAIVLAGTRLAGPDKVAIITIASVMGIVIAIVGFRVQRIEGVYYQQANAWYAEEYRAVYPAAQIPYYSHKPNKTIPGLIKSTSTGSVAAGVRDYFQVLFIAFIAVFIAIAAYAYVTL